MLRVCGVQQLRPCQWNFWDTVCTRTNVEGGPSYSISLSAPSFGWFPSSENALPSPSAYLKIALSGPCPPSDTPDPSSLPPCPASAALNRPLAGPLWEPRLPSYLSVHMQHSCPLSDLSPCSLLTESSEKTSLLSRGN